MIEKTNTGRSPDLPRVALVSASRLGAVMNSSVDAMIVIDDRGRIEEFNPAAERTFGYSASEVIGRDVAVLMPEPYRSEHPQYISSYQHTGHARAIGRVREVEGRRKDGSTFPAEISISEAQVGDKRMYAGVVRDVTERKQLEHSLRQANESLEERVLERTRQLKDSELALLQQADELTALSRISQAISSSLRDDDLYSRFADEVRMLVPWDRLAINEFNWRRGTVTIIYMVGLTVAGSAAGDVIPMHGTVAETAAQTRVPVLLTPSDEAAVLAAAPALVHDFRAGIRSFLTVPLIFQKEVVGALHFRSAVPSVYTESHVSRATNIATHIAGTIAWNGQARLALQSARQAAILARISRILGSTLAIDDVLARSSRLANLLVKHDQVVLYTHSSRGGMVRSVDRRTREVVSTALAGEASWSAWREFERGSGAQLLDGTRLARTTERFPVAVRPFESAKSGIAVPLQINGSPVGVLFFLSRKQDAFSADGLAEAEAVGSQIAGAVANAESHADAIVHAAETAQRVKIESENAQLQRLDNAKTKMLSNVSHELRTPLASMVGFADLLSKNRTGNLTQKQLDQVQIIRRGGRLLNMLISDLLTVARLGADRFELRATEFPLRDLVQEVVDTMDVVTEDKSQSIKLLMQDQPVVLNADRDRLAQVMMNLISNASKYSGEGTQITVEVEILQGALRCSVSDQGVGMTADEQAHLYDRFFRADNEATLNEHGTGLGLYIVKSIVDAQGGSVSVTSVPGKGSTFSFEIPSAVCGEASAVAA